MRGFVVCCAFALASLSASVSGDATVLPLTTLKDVYGPVEPNMEMERWAERVTLKDSKRQGEYFQMRTPENCVFPLEIVIVQDATASFQDDYSAMVNTQIPEMIKALEDTHPNTKFSVVSFRDKPIETLGNASDYCERFDLPLTSEMSKLIETYNKITSIGGADPAENQFGAIVAATQSDLVGWSDASDASTKLVVLSTDAYPHFDLDGLNKYNMTPFTGIFDQISPEGQCLDQYYPSPAQVMKSLVHREAYLAQLVFDGDWQNGLVRSAWEWFNNYIEQTPEFLEPLANDASNFWEKLSLVIKAIEDAECKPLTTTTTTTTVPSTTTTTTATLPSTTTTTTTTLPSTTTTTTLPSTTTTATLPTTTTTTLPGTTTATTVATTTTLATVPTTTTIATMPTTSTIPIITVPTSATTTGAPPCECEAEKPCKCKPAVVIKLKDRPTNLRLVVEN